MSSATTQLRANENSSLYTAVKNRSSATGGAGCVQLYRSEVNHCPSVKTRVEIASQSNAGYDRTIQIVLPNYAFLDSLYLRTQFSARGSGHAADDLVSLVWGAGAFVFTEARLVYQGHVLSRLSPEYIITRFLTESNDSRRDYFGRMIGADATVTSTAAASGGSGDAQTSGARLSSDPEARTIGLTQTFNCPLPFFFEEGASRSLDLSILQSPVHLEIDIGSQSRVHSVITTAGKGCSIDKMEAVCYMTELHPDEQRQFRSVSYQAGGTPLTQLGYNTTTHIETDVSNSGKTTIKLNMFSGLVEKLYVYARLKATNDSATVKDYYDLKPIKSLKLQSTGTDIVDFDLLSTEDKDLEWFNSNSINIPPLRQVNAGTTLTANNHSGKALENIYCLNFKQGFSQRCNADGSLSFGTLSIPQLEIELESSSDFSGLTASGNCDIVIIAEQLDLISYQTNSQGATSIRAIQE